MHRKTILASFAALALAGILLLGRGQLTHAQTAPAGAAPPPTKLAVVNIVDLFDHLDEKAAADAEIDKMRTQFAAESLKRQKEIEDLQKNLGDHPIFKPGSEEYKQQQDDLLQKTMQLQAYGQYAQNKLFLELRIRTADLYSKINKAVADYSQANGIALVFVADDLNVSAAKSQEQLQAMVTLRKLIYFHPNFDITMSIRNKMNADYAAAPKK
ncbi:MAG TPA: OmpH family outer membrane protein [Phycisphaerae bacterium]|jgi:Skp family chaperone for outer membrane proteins|nr:OmpH family outer membrane protein [Phycisphaerae bacterium]